MPHLGPLVPDPEAAVHPRRHPRLRRHVRRARLLQAARGVTCRARVTRVQTTRPTGVQATCRARDTCLTLSGCEAAGEHQHQDRLLPPPHHVSRVTAGWCHVSRVTGAADNSINPCLSALVSSPHPLLTSRDGDSFD